jgi:hypothetical protein
VAQGAVTRDVAWPIVCQGDQDEKIILPNAKREVEDVTPVRGKNTKVIGFPCILGTHPKHKLHRKA